MRALQLEHRAWVDKKYPNQPPEIPAAGCVEEAGELLHVIIKLTQIGIWGEDNRYSWLKLREALVDAIGDCGIYACSLCNANGWDFEGFWQPIPACDKVTTLQQALELVVSAATVATMPKSRISLIDYLRRLTAIAKSVGLDAQMCVRVTWLQVKER